MPKPTIRPPRAPKGEAASVTVANQAREIKNLIERVKALVNERDDALKTIGRAQNNAADCADRCAEFSIEIEGLNSQVMDMEKAYARLQGWQDCAREIINADDGKL